MRQLRIVDSITSLGVADADCVAVSGSHGGTSSAGFAIATRPFLSVFNDAGGGRDNAGSAGLAMLQARGLAACTVSHESARIGDARSTLDEGIINRANAQALLIGVVVGQRCRAAVDAALEFKETET